MRAIAHALVTHSFSIFSRIWCAVSKTYATYENSHALAVRISFAGLSIT